MGAIELAHLGTQPIPLGRNRHIVYQLAHTENSESQDQVGINYITETGTLVFEAPLESVVENKIDSAIGTDQQVQYPEDSCDLCGSTSVTEGPYYFSVLPRKKYNTEYFEQPANPMFSDNNYYTFSEICVCENCITVFKQYVSDWVDNHTQILFSHIV